MADLTTRQDTILALARQQGEVLVVDLAARLSTTPQTVRKELRALEARGLVIRFHGGARLRPGTSYLDYDARARIAARAKAAIGAAVAAEIPSGTTVFINGGTTTEAVARALRPEQRLTLISDNVVVTDLLRRQQAFTTIMAGGLVRVADGAVVGAAAVNFVQGFRADLALIGAAAIAGDGTLMDYDLDQAEVARAMIRNAARVFVVADGGKFGALAPVRIGHLREADALFTDRCDNEGIRRLCATEAVRLEELSQEQSPKPPREAG